MFEKELSKRTGGLDIAHCKAHLKGHAYDYANERADELANLGKGSGPYSRQISPGEVPYRGACPLGCATTRLSVQVCR